MKKLTVPLLALVTIVAVASVLFELHAPLSPAAPSSPSSPSGAAQPLPPPPAQARPPVPAPPALNPRPQLPVANSQPSAPPPSGDPLDVVVRGRTRREWHAYYADRQREITADIQSYQALVDRAIAGEELDPRQLTHAHDQIRRLNDRLKQDLEVLQQIDATP
jgi:hypothetical protein